MPDHPERRVVIAGASGLIGSALAASYRADGYTVTRLVRRRATTPDEVEWLTDTEPLRPGVLDGAEAVIGLNGASIGRFPWTRSYRSTLLWSRLTPTRTLAHAVHQLGAAAPVFVSASAVGYYGDAPGTVLTEDAPRGQGFLADLCAQWEASAAIAGNQTRVASVRISPVVHPDAVLKPMIRLTRLGLGGPIGAGTQSWPWITLPDVVAAIRHTVRSSLAGPVNLAGPTRASADDLGFALARALNRPYLLPAPKWGLSLVLGKAATESLLTSDMHVVPKALTESGFQFQHETVDAAVASLFPAGA